MRHSALAVSVGIAIASASVEAQQPDSSWIIRGGTYAGQSIAIDKSLAAKKGSRFWRISNMNGERRIVGWNPSNLPARVAFRHNHIGPADSVAFWSIIREMEADMGMHLFEPASLADVGDDQSVIVVDTKNMAGDDGVTYITWSNNSAPYDARVFLRSPSTLHDSRVVMHEMMHALGFGHTTSWQSILNSGPAGPNHLTAEDVAYAQAAFESRASNEREDMWTRLALAISREDGATPQHDGYAACPDPGVNPFDGGEMTKLRSVAVLSALTAVTACSARDNNAKGPDTIAVPAAAIDTSTDRPPGETRRAGAPPATGVDTPITRKIGSPAPVKK